MFNELLHDILTSYIAWALGLLTIAVCTRAARRWKRNRPGEDAPQAGNQQ
ncbi:hypothetical protein ACODT5_03235 [Streptomyces sp. 5.8]